MLYICIRKSSIFAANFKTQNTMEANTRKSVERFVNEYDKLVSEYFGGDRDSAMAEDANTYFTLEIKFERKGISYMTTYDCGTAYVEYENDDDEIKELLKWWRGCMKRAKRYFATDPDTLDRIAEGAIEDEED